MYIYYLILHFLALLSILLTVVLSCEYQSPIIIVNTWPFTNATDAGWDVLNPSSSKVCGSSIDAVVAACTHAEDDPNIESVGYGCSPDENGHTLLDALVMDGKTMEVGAVASMPEIRQASQVARDVLFSTKHTLLVGPLAAEFAKSRGYKPTSLDTPKSHDLWLKWKSNNCQPNFRKSSQWIPDPTTSCGPYGPNISDTDLRKPSGHCVNKLDINNHDTIGVIALDAYGSMAVGTSTSGSTYKIPGRVGDSPIPGAGGYVVNNIGGAVATGDGDLMMRYLLSFQVVDYLRQGIGPTEACKRALQSVRSQEKWYGALVALTSQGEHGSACVGFTDFKYSVRASWIRNQTNIIAVRCTEFNNL
ncbi:unnamed protein product [Schistosoma turkestanicum]|nr:unnamed protein product [Schistosoma turkestanicum]